MQLVGLLFFPPVARERRPAFGVSAGAPQGLGLQGLVVLQHEIARDALRMVGKIIFSLPFMGV